METRVGSRVQRSNESRLYGFGAGKDGALGLVAPREFNQPLMVPTPSDTITAVASGSEHTLFLLNDGRVFAAGSNREGQLGAPDAPEIDPSRTHDSAMVEVGGIGDVVAIAAGDRHSLALTSDGTLYAWGSNEFGQLGLSSTSLRSLSRRPTKVSGLSEGAVRIAAGGSHSLALCRDGGLYAWGANGQGQLGIGRRTHFELRPAQIRSLSGIPVALLAAGGSHSLALTVSGAVFAWGAAGSGQLGNGKTEESIYPVHIKALRYRKIVDVACGESHTLALSADGQVYAWGADGLGQAGHGRREDELSPRLVLELAGSPVLRISAGRAHSAALLGSGRCAVWGLGSSGQLGLEHLATRLTPANIPQTAFATPSAVFAGSDRTFVLADPEARLDKMSPGREPFGGRIYSTNFPAIRGLIQAHNHVALGREIENALSNAPCLNASFLVPGDEHFGACSTNHGLDLESLMELNEMVQTLPDIKARDGMLRDMRKALDWGVLRDLGPSPPDIEALRLYLILPWLPPFGDPDNYRSLQVPLATAFVALADVPKKIICKWWSGLKTRHFNRILRVYRGVVAHILPLLKRMQREEEIQHQKMLEACLQLLHRLNEINITSHKVNYDAFYVDSLGDYVNLPYDYLSMKNGSATFTFSSYPFILNATAKSVLLQTDAQAQMQHIFQQTNTQNLFNILGPLGGLNAPVDLESPVLQIVVRRESLVEDTIAQLLSFGNANPVNLKKPLKVQFEGEEGDDAGGLKKEFFLLLRQEILHPKYGMFVQHPDSRLNWFSAPYYQDLVFYKLVGLMFGLAIYNGVLIDLQFPLALYKKLLDREVILEDLEELSPTLGRSLRQLLDYEGEDVEEVFGLTFQASIHNDQFDTTLTEELKEGGTEIPVTAANRAEYVAAYLEFYFNGSIEEQFQAFRFGMARVAPFHASAGKDGILSLFQPPELMEMLTGTETYDWDEFERLTQYKGEYYRHHPTIAAFWEVFHAFDLDEKRKFLLFLTGCDRIPLCGMSGVVMTVQPVDGGETYFPVAHTCFNLLDLPKYSDAQVLGAKLREAIEHHKGFNLA